jgi:phospholipid/cholesterol/gamma-HCH transport system ATP-binding protein
MGYGSRVLLENASFDVRRGEIMAILGGSGSGKSSLMKNIIGLYRPMAGEISIAGKNIVGASPRDKAHLQRSLGVMYQSGALFGSLTVLENVRFPLDQFTDLGLAEKNLTARLLLRQVEMGNAESLMPAELSGGMLKRAGIARAMALGCDILMLDEPSAGLDPITAANLDRTILTLRDSLGFTFVVVTHELQSIFAIADRAIMLDAVSRSIIAEGKPAELKDHSTDARVPVLQSPADRGGAAHGTLGHGRRNQIPPARRFRLRRPLALWRGPVRAGRAFAVRADAYLRDLFQ